MNIQALIATRSGSNAKAIVAVARRKPSIHSEVWQQARSSFPPCVRQVNDEWVSLCFFVSIGSGQRVMMEKYSHTVDGQPPVIADNHR